MVLGIPFKRRLFATASILACCASTVTGAGTASSEFAKSWQGRRVLVTSTLYTVLYDEVGRVGRHYDGKLAGLTVATTDGQYYEFDGPGTDEDIMEPTPNLVFSEMGARYKRAYHLDIGTVQTITPLLLRQYDPGVMLVVDSVKVERTRVRFEFRDAAKFDEGFATSLTVEWPVPLSKAFEERDGVESVIRRFVDPM